MKFLSFLAPILGLLKRFGFLYRIIGIGIAFMLFSSCFKDLMFLSSTHDSEAMTVEELMELPKSEIPRYLKLKDLALLSESYVASEKNGRIVDASYPVYSISQIADFDTVNNRPPPAHVIIKDTHFNEDSMQMFMNVDGLYDHESFSESKRLLEQNKVYIADDAVLIVKSKPPSYNSTLIKTILSGLFGLLIVLSFIPNSALGMPEERVVQAPPQGHNDGGGSMDGGSQNISDIGRPR